MAKRNKPYDHRKQHSTSEIFGINGHRFVLDLQNSIFEIHLIDVDSLKRNHAKIRKSDLEERVRHAKKHEKDVVQVHVGSITITEKRKRIEKYLKRLEKRS